MKMEPRVIDIAQRLEQFSEEFLCHINPKGKVPVLYHPSRLPKPMAESIDISYYICGKYPRLLPTKYADEIKTYINRLHSISFYALTYESLPDHPEAMRQKLLELMNQPNISQQYKDALQDKIRMNEIDKVKGLQPPTIAESVAQATALCADLERVLVQSQDGEASFLFGAEPTVLDCHLLPFLVRLEDVGRGALIPDRLKQYMENLKAQEAWKSVTPSLKTIPSLSRGSSEH